MLPSSREAHQGCREKVQKRFHGEQDAWAYKWRTINGSEDHGQFAFCPVTIPRIDAARETGGQDPMD